METLNLTRLSRCCPSLQSPPTRRYHSKGITNLFDLVFHVDVALYCCWCQHHLTSPEFHERVSCSSLWKGFDFNECFFERLIIVLLPRLQWPSFPSFLRWLPVVQYRRPVNLRHRSLGVNCEQPIFLCNPCDRPKPSLGWQYPPTISGLAQP